MTKESSGEDQGDDLRLVMAAISEAAGLSAWDESRPPLFAGLLPEDPTRAWRTVFECDPPAAVEIAASSADSAESFVIVSFDLPSMRRRLKEAVSGGVSNCLPLMELLGGLPLSVSSRIDAARSDKTLASHFVSTAADHLAEAVRCQMSDLLMPLEVSGEVVHWTAVVPADSSKAWSRLPALLAFATRIHFISGRETSA